MRTRSWSAITFRGSTSTSSTRGGRRRSCRRRGDSQVAGRRLARRATRHGLRAAREAQRCEAHHARACRSAREGRTDVRVLRRHDDRRADPIAVSREHVPGGGVGIVPGAADLPDVRRCARRAVDRAGVYRRHDAQRFPRCAVARRAADRASLCVRSARAGGGSAGARERSAGGGAGGAGQDVGGAPAVIAPDLAAAPVTSSSRNSPA